MEKISIHTSQNVVIEQPLASVGERIVAHLLDYVFYLGYSILGLIIIGALSGGTAVYVLFALPVVFYDLICEMTMEGQSWGKKIMKIRVVKIDGTQLNFFACFTRWIFRIIDNIFLFGGISSLVIIINGKGQRLGDIAANTTVIRLDKNQIRDTILDEVPENYEIKFHEVANLNSSDLYTIKEVLDFCLKNHYIGKAAKMAFAAKESVEKKLSIKSDMVPKKFLETILKDYNALYRG